MTDQVWQLPAPFDVAAWLITRALLLVYRTAAHILSNVSELGPAWAVAYVLALAGFWWLGEMGRSGAKRTLRGNDLWEVDPTRRGAAWIGSLAAWVLRMFVAGPAWIASVAVIVGYGGVATLLAIGLAWRWLALVPALWAAHKILAARRARIMNTRR